MDYLKCAHSEVLARNCLWSLTGSVEQSHLLPHRITDIFIKQKK